MTRASATAARCSPVGSPQGSVGSPSPGHGGALVAAAVGAAVVPLAALSGSSGAPSGAVGLGTCVTPQAGSPSGWALGVGRGRTEPPTSCEGGGVRAGGTAGVGGSPSGVIQLGEASRVSTWAQGLV